MYKYYICVYVHVELLLCNNVVMNVMLLSLVLQSKQHFAFAFGELREKYKFWHEK